MGAFFAMQIVVKKPYSKIWRSYADQVGLLRARGLVIVDEEAAKKFLAYSNYYRFTGYCLRFQSIDPDSGERLFNPGTTFEDVIAVYDFDKELRDCISSALESIEISVRASVAYNFSEAHGPFGHLRDDNFARPFAAKFYNSNGGVDSSRYDEWHRDLVSETHRSNELFVRHFEQNYLQFPDLPIWTALEICSFGTLSKMFANMLKLDMRPVAAAYAVQSSVLVSWLHTFVYVRNICAHHSRLWDKDIAIAPQLPPGKKWEPVRPSCKKLYAVVMLLNWMLAHDSIDPKRHMEWKTRIEGLMDKFLIRFPSLVPYTGFPSAWKKGEIWSLI